jgi:hypothetical protein
VCNEFVCVSSCSCPPAGARLLSGAIVGIFSSLLVSGQIGVVPPAWKSMFLCYKREGMSGKNAGDVWAATSRYTPPGTRTKRYDPNCRRCLRPGVEAGLGERGSQ